MFRLRKTFPLPGLHVLRCEITKPSETEQNKVIIVTPWSDLVVSYFRGCIRNFIRIPLDAVITGGVWALCFKHHLWPLIQLLFGLWFEWESVLQQFFPVLFLSCVVVSKKHVICLEQPRKWLDTHTVFRVYCPLRCFTRHVSCTHSHIGNDAVLWSARRFTHSHTERQCLSQGVRDWKTNLLNSVRPTLAPDPWVRQCIANIYMIIKRVSFSAYSGVENMAVKTNETWHPENTQYRVGYL